MEDDDVSVSDKVDILSTEDARLKIIGEILSSDSSRKILHLLFNQSLTANQISQKTEMSLPLVIHHLKKMQTAGVVKITNVGKNTKSHDMKFYTIDKVALVILPTEMSKPAKKSKSLFNSFTRIHRLATLGGVSIAAWFSTQFLQKTSQSPIAPAEMQMRSAAPIESSVEMQEEGAMVADVSDPDAFQSANVATGDVSIDILWSVIVVLGIVAVGLAIEIVIKQKVIR